METRLPQAVRDHLGPHRAAVAEAYMRRLDDQRVPRMWEVTFRGVMVGLVYGTRLTARREAVNMIRGQDDFRGMDVHADDVTLDDSNAWKYRHMP